MTNEELLQQLKYIQNIKCETQTLELKSAEKEPCFPCEISVNHIRGGTGLFIFYCFCIAACKIRWRLILYQIIGTTSMGMPA